MIKLLVPVIFTDYSLNAVNYALTLAGKFPAEVTLLHCFGDFLPRENEESTPEYLPVENNQDVESKENTTRNRLEALRREWLKQLRPDQDLNLLCRFEYGYPEDLI